MKKITASEKANSIAYFASDKKGEDIVLMDMRKVSAVADWFVLVSVGSSRQINAISKNIQKELAKTQIRPLHVEGRHNLYWVLLDYEDVIVHVFTKETRDFYGLERLWADAPRKRFNDECVIKTSRK
ncbi:MAG: ribosome silencing factor [Candidatus Omnitrophota bacterium]